MVYEILLDLSSRRAWGWPHKVETCRPDKYTILWYMKYCWIYLLGGPEDDLIRSEHVALTSILFCGILNTLGSVFLEGLRITLYGRNMSPWQVYYFMVYEILLDLSSWRAWGWPYKVETCRPDKYTILWYMKYSWICLLGVPEDDLIRSEHVALTSILFYGIWNTVGSVFLEGLRMTL